MTMMFNLREFLARSTDADFDASDLGGVLAGLPEWGSERGSWLAGGALRRTLLGMPLDSDFDFFFRDADALKDFVTGLEKMGLSKINETEHHVHYRGAIGDSAIPRDIQCIRFSFYDDASAVIDSFDFTICQFAFDGETLYCGRYSLWDLGRKRLAVHRITYPVATMRRVLKYTQQGFAACSGALAAILRQTLENPSALAALEIKYID